MRGKKDPEKKSLALKLRLEKRLSLMEISTHLNVPRGTLRTWLAHYPLTPSELEQRRAKATVAGRFSKSYVRSASHLYQMTSGQTLSRHQKARIAEAAVILRLVIHGLVPYGSFFDGERIDLIVENRVGAILKLQVKWAGRGYSGNSPLVSLERTEGHDRRIRYKRGEFDFLVAYDLFSDMAFVWAWAELEGHTTAISICEGSAERWDKIG
jgi:hypothetical protein